MKGPLADDDAKIDPNDGHGESGRENGVDSEGEDTSANVEELPKEGADCSWRSSSTVEGTLGEDRGPAADDDAKMDPKDGDGDGGRKNGVDPDGGDSDSIEEEGDNADAQESLELIE